MIRRFALLSLLLGFLALGCALPPGAPAPPLATHRLPFLDVAEAVGVRFYHDHGGSGRHYLPETMGSGGAFLDYNGDGWPDIYLLQGAALPGRPPQPGLRNRLFENDGRGSFREVPGAAGLDDAGYGMGVCAADIENDGDLDVFVTNFGENALYRNDGGRFTNVARQAGLGGRGWAASAAFGDYDRDGYVDLFVTYYVEYDPLTSPGCTSPSGQPGYCPPETYPATQDRLYRNRGDGTFTDVSQQSGIARERTRGLGVVFTDYDRDGWPDIYVACDMSPNVLWRNQRDGTFKNVAVELGVAFDDRGAIQNGMGVDFGDPDHDGDMDGIVTNFSGQANSYYQNEGRQGFLYRSAPSGLGGPSVAMLGFGCNFLDYDSDGWEDVFIANGHVNDHIAEIVPSTSYAQPAQLFRNEGNGQFREVPPQPGQSIWRARVSRASAIADYDRDGAVDLLVTNCGDRAELFRNQLSPGRRWLTVRLEGTASNRSGIGARIEVVTEATTQTREVRAGSSYLAQSDLAQTFGLGTAERVQRLTVFWPSGRKTVLRDVPAGQVLTVREPGERWRAGPALELLFWPG